MNKLLALALLFATLLVAAPVTLAQSGGGTKIRQFVAALNAGNVSSAQQLTSSSFSLTLADGTTATGSAAGALLATLPTPITIVSLTTADHAAQGTFQFGSSAAVPVSFKGASGTIASMTVSGALGGAPSPAAPSSTAPAPRSLPAGWNLIAAPPGTSLAAVPGALYTLQPGDANYETVQPSAGTTAGYGYWAYFPSTSTLTPAAGSASAYSVRVTAGQYVMIADPSGSLSALISGADIVYTYDSINGYQQATRLLPGQGALALSVAGGTITVTPSAGP